MVIFWISDGHFPILWRNEKTNIEHGLISYDMINLWQLQHWRPVIQGLGGNISVIIFTFIKAFLHMLLKWF